jgi:hypothetical protein
LTNLERSTSDISNERRPIRKRSLGYQSAGPSIRLGYDNRAVKAAKLPRNGQEARIGLWVRAKTDEEGQGGLYHVLGINELKNALCVVLAFIHGRAVECSILQDRFEALVDHILICPAY